MFFFLSLTYNVHSSGILKIHIDATSLEEQFTLYICTVVYTDDCKDLIQINTNVISKYESAKRSRSTAFSIVVLLVAVDREGRGVWKASSSTQKAPLARRYRVGTT